MRVLIGVAAVWALSAAAVLALLLLLPDEDPSKKATEPSKKAVEPPAGPLSCNSLQKRAERCAEEVTALATELAVELGRREGASGIELSARQAVVPGVVASAIGEKKVRTYCRRYWDGRSPRVRRAKKVLEKCWRQTGCKGFVECLREHKGQIASALD